MPTAIPFSRVAVLGTGLIGGSFALSLQRHYPAAQIIGFDRPEVLARAAACGAIHEGATSLGDAVRGADLVYIALPIGATIDALSVIAASASPNALVTDACSTKSAICRMAVSHFRTGACFLGGHPMAGKEHSGIEYADPEIFAGTVYALMGSENEMDSRNTSFSELLLRMGAKPVWLDAETHDWAVGVISHLPQLVSLALARVVRDETDETGVPLSLAGPGLNDVLRLSGSPYSLWRDIILTNKDNISHALDRLSQAIDFLRLNLTGKEIEQEFRAANQLYLALRKQR